MRPSTAEALTAIILLAAVGGCQAPLPVEDPIKALADHQIGTRQQLGAIIQLDEAGLDDDASWKAVEAVLWQPGFVTQVREEALVRLEAFDTDRLKRSIRQNMPNLGARGWQERLCQIIVERGWVDLSPALVSAWANRIPFVDDFDRVEYLALVELHGKDRVVDVVFELFIEPDRPLLRTRCWDLLMRLRQEDRLRALLADLSVGPGDAMLADLRGGVVELGVFPATREEILWLRKLRDPTYQEFWSAARAAMATIDQERRATMELRDLPIVVAMAAQDPELLTASREELTAAVNARVPGHHVHVDPERFEGFPGTFGQSLREQSDRVTWSDLAAMLMALRAVAVPEVASHLFDYAERDRADRSTEYGGVIRLDGRGRFEVVEFPSRFRRSDQEFHASQEMLDEAYVGVFHFHLHAQRHDNERYAGPGMGDINYADRLRANCLVLTFIDENTLNMDFYRHDRLIVDLGEVRRP